MLKNKFNYKSQFRILKGGKISLVVSAILGSVVIASAAPSGGTVTSGTASISQNGTVTNINQDSSKASINWDDFSIKATETVNFNQPNSSSITLNRVIGNEKSVISGALNANGQVWILNSNGVLFNSSASINTAGILGTTAELSDSDFQAGNYDFKNTSDNSVINLGTINVSNGGSVVLASNEVKNSGTIKAVKGKVHLVGADSYSLNLNGNSLVNLTVNKGVLDSMVENSGSIIADGGEVYLTTNAVNELLKGVVNNTGIIEANSLDGLMGKVEVFAHGGEAKVDGTIEVKDGFVETSGKEVTINNTTKVQAENWLIDPTDISIDDSSAYETSLNAGTNVTIETQAAGSEDGDINVNDEIEWNTANTLTLKAHNNININKDITATNDNGKLALHYGQANVNAGNDSTYNVNAVVNLKAGDNFETKQGSDGVVTSWKVITELGSEGSTTGTDLQGINGNLDGSFVLGADIDATSTSTWNDGEGWDAIGEDSEGGGFNGNFNGLGHVIDNLFISRKEEDFQGLFSSINSSTIQNISLTNIDIEGGYLVGGLVGIMINSTITNSHAIGNVYGDEYAGGLVGYSEDSTITNSHAIGNVYGNYVVGGLVGGLVNSTITNSYATGSVDGDKYVGGLVGYSGDSTITNSHAIGNVTAKYTDGGGLIGYSEDSTITDSHATGSVDGDDYIGGLVGYSQNSTIMNSYATGSVDGDDNVGGLVGKNDNSNITSSYATGNVFGDDDIGGLVGDNETNYDAEIVMGTITDSYAEGNVIGSSDTGGLVGDLQSGTITNSYATGSVDGNYLVGGLVGHLESGTITNSYATGSVDGSDKYAGGLVGYSKDSTITNSYATGSVDGNYNVGGLIGDDDESDVSNSFYDKTINENMPDESSYGKTTKEMQTIDTFSNVSWDIEINEAQKKIYPYLTFDTNGGAIWKIGKYPTAINYILSTANTIYNGTSQSLDNFWTNSVFGEDGSSLVYGDDYKFIYDASIVNGLTNTGTYSDISIKLLNDDYEFDETGTNTLGSLTITPKAITVSADDLNKVYGSTDEALTYTASGLVGTDTLAGSLKREVGEDVADYAISQGTLTNSNYKVTFTDGKYTITPKAITVSADNLTKVYGQEDETLTYTATGLLGEDTLVGSLKRAAGENAGDYTISENTALTNSNYTVTFTDGKYTITPKAITVSADDLTKVYGQEDATLTYKATGLLGEDTLAGSLKREVGEDVADYAISQGTLANSNYTVTFTNGKYTITPKAITVSADNLSKVYGQEDAALTYTANGLETGDTLVGSLKRAEGEDAGEYTISQDTALTNSNYTVTFTDGKYTITPKAIEVRADDLTKVYGDEDEVLTYTANGLVGEDTLVGSLKRAAGENAGDYTISENVALTNSNYTVTFENGKYTITPKAITVSADDLTKVYGQEDAALTYTANGLETGDTLVGSLKRAEGEDAGEYTISQDTALTNSNYTVTFTDGKYTITPKAIEVRADDLTKVYGDEDEVLTYTANGLVGQDTLAGILQRVEGEDAGDYEISQGNLANSNYVISFENGIYTITPATNSNIDNIIATIIKTNVKVPTAPVKVVVNNNPNIVSQPEAEEVATQIVTLSEIKTNQENSQTNEGSQTQQDVRVPISKNSVIELVNGGVNLPEGVDQQFFVANTDSQEN
ncbi:hypothetical protein LPB137_04400 [Poseidonibacter parvus]|uniref:Filamentous haemagglutinin FhaB/tRNA nuclease CdiA-like TPS domain-containing protein n=1 Tax=Poseidonibacter parvus TaxID=1850254 RepID=A0A1P8KKP9_9BACT|nr:MBG domain-containing protein [Poseidonibacter parvus]APW65133.1 hypothetical protein LPB137_04400 [Poseidonibacter parvus]